MLRPRVAARDRCPPKMTTQRRTEREVSRSLHLDRAARSVDELRRMALAAEQEFASELDATAPSMRESAYNLVHYLAVRRHDVRELQDELTRLRQARRTRLLRRFPVGYRWMLPIACTGQCSGNILRRRRMGVCGWVRAKGRRVRNLGVHRVAMSKCAFAPGRPRRGVCTGHATD